MNPASDDWKSTEGDRGGCMVASKGRRLSSIGPGSDENHVADEDIADTREHESKNDSQFESSP